MQEHDSQPLAADQAETYTDCAELDPAVQEPTCWVEEYAASGTMKDGGGDCTP